MKASRWHVTFVDPIDAHLLENSPCFTISDRFQYPRIKIDGRWVFLSRTILGLPIGRNPEAEHRDRDPLNNRRANLRVATRTQNLGNRRKRAKASSVYKGVSRHKRGWTVTISSTYLGKFTDEKEAARVYDKAAQERWGEFACLNFPM